MSKKTFIVGGILVLLGAAVYFFASSERSFPELVREVVTDVTEEITKENTEGSEQAATAPESENDKFFTSSDKTFTLARWEGMRVNEVADSGGMLVVIESAKAEAAQVFSIQFDEPESVFTEERLRRDIPDLKIEGLKKVRVDGASALAFYSDNPAFGSDSYEVWFVKSGMLYQISSSRAHKPVVDMVISAWKFN